MSTTILEENEEVEFSSVREAEGGENFSDRESRHKMLARK
jgi:hypothetical protein